MELVQLERTLQAEYNQTLNQEELLWFHKSREQWVRFGDKNTSLFHAQTLTRRKRNKIKGLHIVGDVLCTDGELLKQEALSFFKKLFVSANPLGFRNEPFPVSTRLGGEAHIALEKKVSMEDV